MKEKYLPWFLLFCALGLSFTAAYYSVLGLSLIFAAVAIPVIIMGSFLEVSKIAIATYLHNNWKQIYGILKIYLSVALITLSVITSIGIYGLLTTGFQKNISGMEVNVKKVENINVKKKQLEELKGEYQKEKTQLDKDITNLRTGLASNTTTQIIDRKTGQLTTRENRGNRVAFENQLNTAQKNRDELSIKLDTLNNQITRCDLEILNITSSEIQSGELGAIKYLSEITGWDIKKTANFFILILIFVFDPLAIALVIATNQAFKSKRKDSDIPDIVPEQSPEVEKKVEVLNEYEITQQHDESDQNNPIDLFSDKENEELVESDDIEVQQEISKPKTLRYFKYEP